MKIRWTKNSVRFRITPHELEELINHRPVSEEISWGNGYWEATVGIGHETGLWFEKMILQIRIAPQDVKKLAEPDNEGVYFSTTAGPEGEAIRYIIEKDFPCAHPRAGEAEESPTETFEPPPGFEERKNRPFHR
jgi:hypothetical protein